MAKYVKKTIELDEDVIKKLRRIFDVKTDKDAVNKAMLLVSTEDDIIQTHDKLGGSFDIDEVF